MCLSYDSTKDWQYNHKKTKHNKIVYLFYGICWMLSRSWQDGKYPFLSKLSLCSSMAHHSNTPRAAACMKSQSFMWVIRGTLSISNVISIHVVIYNKYIHSKDSIRRYGTTGSLTKLCGNVSSGLMLCDRIIKSEMRTTKIKKGKIFNP